jgi:ribulose-phosphate 3-epimerase
MADIIPAVLPKNYEDLKNKIALVRGLVPGVQIDICDGVFVPNITWPFLSASKRSDLEEADLDEYFRRILNEQEGLPFWEDIDFELDLMVMGAVENFDVYTKLGPKRIIFHLEAVGDLEEFKRFLEGIDVYIRDVVEIGVAINSDTPITEIFPLVNSIDFVQCMGIEKIGFQGQEFDERAIKNIKKLKEKFSDLIISVDGGVDFETAPALIEAGANRLVIGSAIFNTDDIIDTIERFKSL